MLDVREGEAMDVDAMDVDEDQISLVELPEDALNVIWSCLTFDDFRAVSVLSSGFRAAVGRSRYLHMRIDTSHSYQQKRILGGPSPAAEMHSPLMTIESLGNAKRNDLTLPQQEFQNLLTRFKNLNVLTLHSGLAAVEDQLVSLINKSEAASTLQYTSLHGCSLSYWCQEALDLPFLTQLVITGSGSIRVSFSRLLEKLPRLTRLEIGQSTTLRDDTVRALSQNMIWSHQLTELTLRQCARLRRPRLQFAGHSLTHLSLAGCFSLVDLPELACPNLRGLDLSFCVRLRPAALYGILERLPELEKLALVECISLESLRISSSTLNWLNVGFCSSLQELELDCPNLKELENTSCISLSGLRLHQCKLVNLDLNFLSRLRHVEVDAPCLERLGLEECRKLEFVRIVCPQLKVVRVQGSKMTAHRFNRHIRQTMVQGWSAAGARVVDVAGLRL